MQEIADRAGINKGLLHYYFRSKEALFKVIFREAFTRFSKILHTVLSEDRPLLEKIDRIVDEYMDLLCQNPALPGFIVNELPLAVEMLDAPEIAPPLALAPRRSDLARLSPSLMVAVFRPRFSWSAKKGE